MTIKFAGETIATGDTITIVVTGRNNTPDTTYVIEVDSEGNATIRKDIA